ncbi:zinc finger protein 512B isoform X1 [Solea solea]|uniref:zinc finger protein 512B isoform X1 n=1 Tax=Solea solea TaxID=90069 RepID=UPI00272D50B6|nr:zinc finger protein 512B isoform X1 [Solea solea]XP_058498621.1 zinc finger protein 512B isoform X1 [Solea solea]XP_058498622.1 zinc finger protein 512B isoform X1 [Solea solea]
MESPGSRLGKLSSSGLPKGRTPKHGHPQETVRNMAGPENNKHMPGPVCDEPAEGKRKGRPKADVQELRSIPAHMIVQWKEEFKRRSRVKCPCSGCWLEFPSIYGVKYHYQRCQGATVAEKLSHGCPYCEAVFATKVHLHKHKLWNHPDRVTMEGKEGQAKLHKTPVKSNTKKRPLENSPPSPVFFKVKKIHEVSTPSQNGDVVHQRSERKQHSQQIPQSLPVLPHSQQSQCQSTSSDAGGSESEGGSLPPSLADEDPERMKHRRKQKTPKKFTGEQPSISGTFGLKGMTKVEEKLKAGRAKRPEGSALSEDPQRRPAPAQSAKKDSATTSSGVVPDTQWQRAISERGEVVCPSCSIVTRKTIHGLKKHMEICKKLQDALKCQQCQKQFRSKAGLNYHTMAEHSNKPSGSEGQTTGDEHEERERLRRVLKQMGRIKCPSEGCSAHFSSLTGYQYHQKRCGGEFSDDEKPVFLCQHCGKTYHSTAGRDYHIRAEHSATITATAATNNNNSSNNKDNTTDSNNNTGKERVLSEESPAGGKKEQNQPEKMDWQKKSPSKDPKEKQRETRQKERGKEKERESVADKAVRNESQGEDFERTPSGRVRRRSAQVAVFHLQEIAEDELAKDWGTKRRIKDDLVPDSKRLNYTRPGLPNFSPELLETWKNQVKEKGFICCTNENCEAVYSSVSGLKAHLANCSQGGGELGKYTCLLCQKEFSSESGVKYHISKTHSQNWFRAAENEVVSSSKNKAPQNNGIKAEVTNCAAPGKKRGRKPKERPSVVEPLQTNIEAPAVTENSAPATDPSLCSTKSPSLIPNPSDNAHSGPNRQPVPSAGRRSKPKRLSLSE